MRYSILAMLLLASCNTFTPTETTRHPDGTVTTRPVLSPDEEAWQRQCDSIQNLKLTPVVR